jgi:hypothetical protein
VAGTPDPGAFLADVDRDARRTLVAATADPELNGVDFVEVLPGHRTLLVFLLRGPVPPDLRATGVAVLGGVRLDPAVNPVRVLSARPATEEPDVDVDPDDRDRVLVVRTSSAGDWSTYLLRLLGPGGVGVPAGFDEPLASAPFRFTVDCPSDLDCRQPDAEPVAVAPTPLQDYLARDYEALRSRLLDRLASLLPDWTDRNPADLGVTLAELFAYLGDRLAYWQDAVGTEAYLSTARHRTSVRRHARMLDYRVHQGCAARAWLVLTTPMTVTLPAGTAATSADGGVVFGTCHPVALAPERDRIPLHSWGDPDHVLPAGSTSAFVLPDADPGLRAGDVVALSEPGADRWCVVRLDREPVAHTDPLATGTVYELHWYAADALPFGLRVTGRAADGAPEVTTFAWANTALADHGATVTDTVDPEVVPADGRYRPRLRQPGLAWALPDDTAGPATDALRTDPAEAVAQLTLDDGDRTWTPRPDLLASGALDTHVVVETEDDGASRLRFGDGQLGLVPSPGPTVPATYRVGGGVAGNVAAGTLTRLLAPDGLEGLTVTNPLPAAGGRAPQPIAEVRELAPYAFRTQLRAVTPADYAAVAMEHPSVQRAVARRRWAGSWYAVEATIDPLAAAAEDAAVPAEVAAALEVRRMAGVDVEVARPVYVPLEIVLVGCAAAGFARADSREDIAAAVQRELSAGTLPDGRRGFFHPDNLSFGQPVYLSQVVAAAMRVPGVASVGVARFARLGHPDRSAAGVLEMGAREVARADSDPSNPENGRVDVLLGGAS